MRKISLFIAVLISFSFIIHFSSMINDFKKGEQTCICAYDGFGYYMYLPSLFENKTLNIDKEWAQAVQNEYCNNTETYQLILQPNGNHIDLYHIGLSYLQLPSYSISHFYAKAFGYKTDGFSLPFTVGFLLNALLFCLIGIIYLRKLLLLFFNDTTTSLVLVLLYASTNTFITFTIQKDLPHLYIFALNSVFLYHLILFIRSKEKKHLLISALIFGITVAIRPTQALLGLIPLILLWKQKSNYKSLFTQVLCYPIFALLWNLPQIAYWYFIGGKLFMPNLHTEEIIIIDPNLIDFLFSFRKGWLIYSPVFILSFIGFSALYKRNKNTFWALFASTSLYILIMSSWECWWYASSYGSRAMTDIYPFLIIPIAFLWESLNNKYTKSLFLLFSLLFLSLNIFQSYQFKKGLIHPNRMSKEQYFYIFGKTSLEGMNSDRLLINRGNKNWINSIKNTGLYEIDKRTILFKKKTVGANIKKIILLDKVKSDETLIEVSFDIKFISKKIDPIYLKIETCSRFNCYDWQSIEISRDTTVNHYQKVIYRFNLPDIRHRKDKLQTYITNTEEVEFEIKNFKIDATTAIRN